MTSFWVTRAKFHRNRRSFSDSRTQCRRQGVGPYNEGLKVEPSAGPGTEPLIRGVEAETLLAFGRSMEAADLPSFQKFETQKIKYNLCCFCKKMKSNRPQ